MSTTTHLSYSQYRVRTVVARVVMIIGTLWILAAAFDAAQAHFVTTFIGLAIIGVGYALKWYAIEHLDYRYKN